MTKEIVRSGLRLTKDLNHDLTRIAQEIGMTKNQLMVKILWDWVKEQRQVKTGPGSREEVKVMDKKICVLNALASFVKRASKKGATAEEIALLPAVAKVLLDYLSSDESRDSSVL